MKILVTGGYGLVGKALQEEIKQDDRFVFIGREQCDLTEIFDIDSYFNYYKPEIVIHLASKVGGLYDNMNDNFKYLIDNIKIHTNVIECCKKYNIKRLLNILSTCIFPDKAIYPLTSDQIHNGSPHTSNEGYAYSKRILHTLSKLSGIQCVNLIPTNLYGKNDNFNVYTGHVIPALIHKIYESKKNNLNLYLPGSGNAHRQFLFANDFAKIILHFTNCSLEHKITDIIVSPDEDHTVSIKDLTVLIKKHLNFKKDIVFTESELGRNDGQEKKPTNSKEMSKYLINFSFTSLEDGLKKSIEYFVENFNTIRKY